MKKGFLLTKLVQKIASTSSTTQVIPTSILKSLSTNCYYDVIVDFFSGLIKRNPSTIFNSITMTDLSAIDEFLNTYKDQVVPMEKLLLGLSQNSCFLIITQFLATFLNLFLLDDENQKIFLMDSEIHQVMEYARKLFPNIADLGDPMYQSDASMNFDMLDADYIRSLDDSSGTILLRNVTPIFVTHLTKSQKRSAKKRTRKEKQKLQLQTPSGLDEQVVPTFSIESPEYTPSKPSGSKTVTFNTSLFTSPFTPFKLQLKRDSKPQSTPNNNGKKLKQKETDNMLKNRNVIITRYVS
ncbi:hypothetical protein RclHR1_01510013 [Rhizophagus clarus]|uniref:Uncharacterized protein n=1 Tax=Rhizophagus clarus TaxID=94130 RepID=A0A2Z6QIM7_9GLOM|nr:hypothetical protein RclHR1_01510013 [Rhizophagus clarus]GES98373.1 hypothetical protein RCL_e2863_RclHR1_01510013 [Rhizophagus clarus]